MKTLTKILGSGAFALALAVPSCRDDIAYTPEVPSIEKTEKYTLEDFKQVLGERYDPKKEIELERAWKFEKESLISLIQDYEEKGFKPGFIDKKTIKEYEQFSPTSLSPAELDKYQKQIPWKVISDEGNFFTEVDRVIIYGMKKMDEPDTVISNLGNWNLLQ